MGNCTFARWYWIVQGALSISCATDDPPTWPTCELLGQSLSTSEQIFAEMSSTSHVGKIAHPLWTSHLASSYDRASTTPGSVDWYANSDAGGFVALEGDEHVMLDTAGPGALLRIWSANPDGVLRIVLYGEDVFRGDMVDFLNGRVTPFSRPFASSLANGKNLIYPFPFAERARVTTSSTSLYYNIDYRLYPAETNITRSTGDSHFSCQRAQAEASLRGTRPEVHDLAYDFALNSSGPAAIVNAFEGGSIIKELTIDVDRVDATTLRRTLLVASFDGENTVKVPLGDFFAYNPEGIEVNALAMVARHDGHFLTRFEMPFLREASFQLIDMGGGPINAGLRLIVQARPFDERSLFFHARWSGIERFDIFSPSLFHVAKISGQGNYVGTVLHVANPSAAWWGEGDEQIWVDQGDFPTHFGTGTEDYFGYAWCTTKKFSHAYFGQTRVNQKDFAGFISLYRFIAFISSTRSPLQNHLSLIWRFCIGKGGKRTSTWRMTPCTIFMRVQGPSLSSERSKPKTTYFRHFLLRSYGQAMAQRTAKLRCAELSSGRHLV